MNDLFHLGRIADFLGDVFFLRSIRTTATTRSRNGTYDNLNCNYHQELLSEKKDFIVKDLMSQRVLILMSNVN